MEETDKNPKHLLIVRLSAMGDVAMLPHAIRALRTQYPDLRVSVATRALFRPFFEGLGVEILEVDTRSTHRGLRGIWRLACEARRTGVDAVADVHGVVRSIVFSTIMRLMGRNVAFIRKGRIEKWFRLGYSSSEAVPLKHTVVRYCDVFRRLGFTFDDPAPVTERPALESPMGEKTGTWVGFAPFSAHAGKTYPEPLRSEVVHLLAERYDRVFIHSGSGKEQLFAEKMESLYPNVTALFGRVSLNEELALIAHLDCVVSMDSLVMHLGALVATPVVSVWGATHPELGFLGYGCDTEGVLQSEIPCRPCSVYGNKPCKTGDYRCIHAITPEMVVERVARLIEKSHAEPELIDSDSSDYDSTAEPTSKERESMVTEV